MSQYVIGDIQGCYDEFVDLLHLIDFNPGKDTVILAGDVVNRGPKSLETLKLIKKHESSMRMVLGNHDLSLLHIWYAKGKVKKHDTIQDVINSPEAPVLMDWLRKRPMMIVEDKTVVVHAGLWPEWRFVDAFRLSLEAENVLAGKDPRKFLENMYGNIPDRWNPDEKGDDRIRFILNVMSRMRCLNKGELRLDYEYNKTLEGVPKGLVPWFRWPERKWADYQVVFGHWSALGLHEENGTVCLDTGAVWGEALTAMDFDLYVRTGETKFFQTKSSSGIDLL